MSKHRTFQKMLKFFFIPFFSLFLSNLYVACKHLVSFLCCPFFSILIFCHEHIILDSQDSRGRGGYLFNPLYYFHLLHRHLDTSWAVGAEISPLHIASSGTLAQEPLFSEVVSSSSVSLESTEPSEPLEDKSDS